MSISHAVTFPTATSATNVALGQFGRVFFDTNNRATLGGTADATPIWQRVNANVETQPLVAAADKDDVLVSLTYEMDFTTFLSTPVVTCWSSKSATPKWTYRFPYVVNTHKSGLHVSRDGRTIVAWLFTFDMKVCINSPTVLVNGIAAKQKLMATDVVVLRPDSNTPMSYTSIYTAGQPMTSALSADGSTLLLATGMKQIVFKTSDRTLAVDVFVATNIAGKCAISGDGTRHAIARASRYVDVFGYGALLSTIDFGEGAMCNALAISDDRQTLVAGLSMGGVSNEIRVRAFALGFASPVVLLQDSFVGSPTGLAVSITSIAVSSDASVIAVGTTGDASGNDPGIAPGLIVYEGLARSLVKDMSGSVLMVDVAVDGSFVACASRTLHSMRAGNSTGEVNLFGRLNTPPPSTPTEYRATIPYPAVVGSTHFAQAVPSGSGAPVKVQVIS